MENSTQRESRAHYPPGGREPALRKLKRCARPSRTGRSRRLRSPRPVLGHRATCAPRLWPMTSRRLCNDLRTRNATRVRQKSRARRRNMPAGRQVLATDLTGAEAGSGTQNRPLPSVDVGRQLRVGDSLSVIRRSHAVGHGATPLMPGFSKPTSGGSADTGSWRGHGDVPQGTLAAGHGSAGRRETGSPTMGTRLA